MAMRRSLSILVLLGVCASADLFACGDKFLVISRGTRFQRSATERSAADILIYATSASTLPAARGTGRQPVLCSAGVPSSMAGASRHRRGERCLSGCRQHGAPPS